MMSIGIRLAMSARVSLLFPLLGGRRGTLGGSSGINKRGGKPADDEVLPRARRVAVAVLVVRVT